MLPDPGTTPLALERVRALQSGELDHGILSYLHLKRVLDTAIPDAAERGRYAVAHEAILMHSSTMRVAFSSHPIAALLILCDTLQEWGPPRARDWEPAYPEPHFADHVGLVRRRAAAELAGIELRDAEPAITAPSWEFQLAYSTADTLDLLPLRLCIEKCHGMQRLDLRGFPCRIHVKLTIQHRGFGASRVSGIEALRSYALSRPELGMLEFFEGGPGDAKAVAFEANREQDTISFHAHMLSGLPLLPQRLDLDWSDVARRLGSPAPVPAGVQAIVHPDDDDQRGDLEGVLRNELWRVLRTPEVESSRRCSVLAELIRRKDRALPSFILSELSVDDLPESWRGTLILAAEDVVFPERGQRARLKQLLLDAGTALRDSLRVESEPAFWAAIRRFASLASQADAPCLLRFLRPADGVAARQLAFQALQNIFASSPPSDPEALIALRDRVADLALKYLDVDLLTPGENASLAQNACHALAALGDERLPDCARRLLASDRPWLIRRVMDVLHDLHVERVADASTLCVADPGSRAIEESLDILGHARDPS